MNYRMIRNIVGKIMILVSIFMILPMIVSFIYKEGITNYLAYLIPILILFGGGYFLSYKKLDDRKLGVKEGFIIVALSWIVMSLFGCIPFMISGDIPNFFDAFFEMTSGFTTTGASVVDVTVLSHSTLFWRSFSHWIGGMGMLVFILMVIPESKEGSTMHILRAESPGPQVGKLVSKMKLTSRYLYLIYFGLTVIELLLLWLGPDEKMTFFNSLIYSLGTAGTGGFAMDAYSLEFYSNYSQYVIAIFMLIFGINFTMFYLILIGSFKAVFKNEEVKTYLIMVAVSVIIITINIYGTCKNLEEAFRLSLFQVSSIVSTTGYSTTNFINWPSLSLLVLLLLMISGACAGSTAGGMKVSRIVILAKSFVRNIKRMIAPRKIETLKINGKTIEEEQVESVQSFLVVYFIVLLACAGLISIDGYDVLTNLTASLTCISNVGPGLTEHIGPYGSFSIFSDFSKIVLSLEMIAGRLEIFPLLILFYPRTWLRK